MVGEKLNSALISNILNQVFKDLALEPKYFFMAPKKNPLGYLLFIDGLPPESTALVADKIEDSLAKNYHYNLARELMQLDKVRVIPIDRLAERYSEILNTQGMELGNIKPNVLSDRFYWEQELTNGI